MVLERSQSPKKLAKNGAAENVRFGAPSTETFSTEKRAFGVASSSRFSIFFRFFQKMYIQMAISVDGIQSGQYSISFVLKARTQNFEVVLSCASFNGENGHICSHGNAHQERARARRGVHPQSSTAWRGHWKVCSSRPSRLHAHRA